MFHFHKIFVLFFLILYTATILPAGGGKETEGSKLATEPVPVTVSGRVRLTGNSPMTSLVITGENREWHIEQSEEKKLTHLQQQTVTVSGKEYYFDYFFANGSFTERRYFIKDITLIN